MSSGTACSGRASACPAFLRPGLSLCERTQLLLHQPVGGNAPGLPRLPYRFLGRQPIALDAVARRTRQSPVPAVVIGTVRQFGLDMVQLQFPPVPAFLRAAVPAESSPLPDKRFPDLVGRFFRLHAITRGFQFRNPLHMRLGSRCGGGRRQLMRAAYFHHCARHL